MIACRKCGGMLVLDDRATVKDYIDLLGEVVTPDGSIDFSRCPDYMFYTCIECNSRHKFTLADIERMYREDLVREALRFRRNQSLEDIPFKEEEADSGFVYCGGCFGMDGNGNCFKHRYEECKLKPNHV